MPKKTVLLIFVLALITVALLHGTLHAPPAPLRHATFTAMLIPPKVNKTAILYFDPSLVHVTPNSTSQTISLMVNTGNSSITGIQIALSYNPKLIKNLAITPSPNNFFGTTTNFSVLKSRINDNTGKANFILAIQPLGQAQTGTGTFAQVTFTPVSQTSISQTEITFTAETKVTKENQDQSILKSTTPLTLSFITPTIPQDK